MTQFEENKMRPRKSLIISKKISQIIPLEKNALLRSSPTASIPNFMIEGLPEAFRQDSAPYDAAKARIHALDPQLCNQIAAGEVVERPGSALKELIENSLDAGATQIRVEIEQGGAGKLLVADNGSGILAEDLPLALARHATSKIQQSQDLFAIQTWGFRGEALAAIAAVSRLTISSQHKNASEGRELIVEAGTVAVDRKIHRTVGTTLKVEELFFNTPVRRKFLKSTASETSYCIQTVQRLALSTPEVDWELWVDDRKELHYPPANDPRDRIVQVFREGLRTKVDALDLIPLNQIRGDLRLRGFLLPSSALIPSTRGIFTYVNRRSVKDKLLQQAIIAASREVLFGSTFPQIVLHIDTSPENVDVNVHPTKAEVRFRNGSQLFGLIRATLEAALAAQRPVSDASSSSYLSNSPAFGSANLSLDLQTSALFKQKQDPLYEPLSPPSLMTSAPPSQSASIMNRKGPQFLCTLKNTYLLCQDEEGLLLIDQHAAHERVTYERLKTQQWESGTLQSSALLIPIIVELPLGASKLLLQAEETLRSYGLDFHSIGPQQVAIRAIPALLLRKDGSPAVTLHTLFRALAEELETTPPEAAGEILRASLLESLASQSCHGSVRAGQILSPMQVEALLQEMSETDFAGHCPHGRPTTVRLKWSDVERMFKRIT